MLSRPFRAMGKGTLIVLLLVFLLLEAAGGAGLYLNNRSAAAAVTPHTGKSKPCSTGQAGTALKIQNTPRTVIVGHNETFSVCLKDLPNVLVTYTVSYSDGTRQSETVLTDRTGFSKKLFLINYKPHGNRESIGVAVFYSNQKQAATRFAVQVSTSKK